MKKWRQDSTKHKEKLSTKEEKENNLTETILKPHFTMGFFIAVKLCNRFHSNYQYPTLRFYPKHHPELNYTLKILVGLF